MAWVYYPATLRNTTGRDFGNAVLSRWPIVSDAKLILPHLSIFGSTVRTATRATVRVGRMPIQVYSVHLATAINQSLWDRRDQMRAVLHDASRYPHVVIGGDLNSSSLGRMAVERGYAWPTGEGPGSTRFFGRLDHILFKGLDPLGDAGSGTVPDVHHASDHRPVWAVGVLR
jgi:endonuclease/exonuclease/phosphatase family metal-dependent hydrolase